MQVSIDQKIAHNIEMFAAQQMANVEQDAIKQQKELDKEQQQERDGS